MLNKISANELVIGKTYSAPLFFDDGKNMLLPEGVPISEYEIGILKRWNIQYVLTEGKPITDVSPVQQAGKDAEVLIDDVEELEEFEEVSELEDLTI